MTNAPPTDLAADHSPAALETIPDTGHKTRPFSVVRFGTNAILKRLPSVAEPLTLGRDTLPFHGLAGL